MRMTAEAELLRLHIPVLDQDRHKMGQCPLEAWLVFAKFLGNAVEWRCGPTSCVRSSRLLYGGSPAGCGGA